MRSDLDLDFLDEHDEILINSFAVVKLILCTVNSDIFLRTAIMSTLDEIFSTKPTNRWVKFSKIKHSNSKTFYPKKFECTEIK